MLPALSLLLAAQGLSGSLGSRPPSALCSVWETLSAELPADSAGANALLVSSSLLADSCMLFSLAAPLLALAAVKECLSWTTELLRPGGCMHAAKQGASRMRSQAPGPVGGVCAGPPGSSAASARCARLSLGTPACAHGTVLTSKKVLSEEGSRPPSKVLKH